MWRTAVLVINVIVVIVTTAPVYRHERGPKYAVKTPDHGKPFVEIRNGTFHGSGPREEARAMCSIKTQEINATANATITRRIHGAVTSRELHLAIQRLEVLIFGQTQQLWKSFDALRAQLSGDPYNHFPDRNRVSFSFRPGQKQIF